MWIVLYKYEEGVSRKLPRKCLWGKRAIVAVVVCLGCVIGGARLVLADTLYTEPHGARAQYLSGVASWQFVGVRFDLAQPAQITSLHAELGDSPSSFFAALVSLPSATSLPQGNPFAEGEVAHSTVFTLTWDIVRVDIPFNVTVGPGAYGIVFGGDQFGSATYIEGVVGSYNTVPGSSGFVWVSDSPSPLTPWHDTPGVTFNVAVEGMVIPEPSSLSLCVTGVVLLWSLRWFSSPHSQVHLMSIYTRVM